MRRSKWPAVWLILAAVVALCILFGRAFIHFWGIDTQQSDNYDFFSGPGPVWVSALGLSTIITGMWHSVNCHIDRCHRVGRYHVADGHFRVCRRHHPDERVRTGLRSHHVAELHRRHEGNSLRA